LNGDFRLESWLVRPSLNTVSRNKSSIQLEPKVMSVLVCLAEHAPEPVSKEKLMQVVWPNTFVGDGVLTRSISELRRVFEDEANESRVIQTIAKHGYRLVAPVTRASGKIVPSSVDDSIVVLPFLNLSADQENEFFCDGTTEEIISALAHIKNLHVVARTSAFAFKGKHVDLRAVGQQLNVRTVLEGSIRRSGDRLRITAQLVNAADGYQLWSEKYDREMKDVFAIQEEIANSIAQRLEISLDSGRQSLIRAGTENLDAFKFYVQGRSPFFQRGLRLLPAVESFKRAVATDPKYALAWSGLADALNMAAFYGLAQPEQCLTPAKEAAQRAIELDPSLAEAHTSLAMCHLLHGRDCASAERAFLRSLELKPRDASARSWYGVYFLHWVAGRLEEALAETTLAVQIDPLSAYARAMQAVTYTPLDVNRCLETAEEALRIDPHSFVGHFLHLTALNSQRRFAEAADVGESLLKMSGRFPWVICSLVRTYAALGKAADAEALYMELRWRSKREYVTPAFLGFAACAAGETDEAIRYELEALAIGDPPLIAAKYWPDFAELREDSRFQEILRSRGWT
jgi:TolB-like protein